VIFLLSVVAVDTTTKLCYLYYLLDVHIIRGTGDPMQFSSRMATAIHILLYLAEYETEEKVTSEVLADTTGVNAVNIRKTLAMLKNAGLVEIPAGIGGASLAKDPQQISLGMIFRAVEDEGTDLFRIHEHPNTACPVGRTIKSVLDGRLNVIRDKMLSEMDGMLLSDLYMDMKMILQEEMQKHEDPGQKTCIRGGTL